MKKYKKNIILTGLGLILLSSLIFISPNTETNLDKNNQELSSSAGEYNYVEALQKAIYFYLQQRTGELPDDNPVFWRDDSCLNDGTDVGLDLSGGYLDAGDHVKFGLPMASTMTSLAWNVMENEDIIRNSGLYDELIDAIRWGTDYFMKCNPNPNDFYFQVGAGATDHQWWGAVELMDDLPTRLMSQRPSYKVTATQGGSAVCAGTAAALIATSILLEDEDPSYAAECLSHAEDLIDLAEAAMSDAYYNTIAAGFYQSWSGFYDELSTAYVLMYMKTGDSSWLTASVEAATHWNLQVGETVWEYAWSLAWDDMHYIAQIFLARITGESIYIDSIERNIDWWLPGGGITYSPGDQAHLTEWGSLRHSTDQSFVTSIWLNDPLCTASKLADYKAFIETQVNYALGSNPRSSSYLIGFGDNYPLNPHHRTAHGTWTNTLSGEPVRSQHILHGALVGGPRAADDQYQDDRADYYQNEVAMDYNMGIVGALTYMAGQYGGSLIDGFPRYEDFRPEDEREAEYYCDARISGSGETSMTLSVDLTNHASWPATALYEMSYRYYFDISEIVSAGGSINDVSVTLGYSQASTTTMSGPTLYEDTSYYIEVDMSGTPIMPADLDESAKECSVTFNYPSSWSDANDYSYQGMGTSASDFTKNDYMPVYNAGSLIGGIDLAPAEPPVAPTGLSATAASWDAIDVDWNNNAEPNIAYYQVYRSTSSGFTPSTSNLIGSPTGSSYSDTGLNFQTTYYYKVIAVNSLDASSSASSQASATTLAYHAPPAAPTGLAVASKDENSISLNWNDNSESDIAYYQVIRDEEIIAEPTTSSFVDTGLLPDTTYAYNIKAVNTYGTGQVSEASSTLSVTTDADLDAPAQPSGLSITAITDNQIALDWNDNSESDFSHYTIHMSTSSGFNPTTTNQVGESTESTYISTGLISSTTYYYKIIAIDTSSNPSSASSEASATTLVTFDGGLITNGDFSDDITAWTANVYGGSATFAVTDGELVTSISYAGTENWNIQIQQQGFTIENNVEYTVSFLARASGDQEIFVGVGEYLGSYTSYGDQAFTLDTTMQAYSFTFTMAQATDTGARIDFNLGLSSVDIIIDNVAIHEKGGIDTLAPTISNPSDISYIVSTTGHSITWSASDLNPDTYTITRDGTIIDSGSWFSGNPITINIDGLSADTYTYSIVINDVAGNTVSDSVNVEVTSIVNDAPYVSSPSDISYQVSTTGHTISWTATDSNPDTYIITRDGVSIDSGSWSSGNPIIVNVDGLSADTYTYTIVVVDTLGLSDSDSVNLVVTSGIVEGGDVWMGAVGAVQPGSTFVSTIYVDTGIQKVATYGIKIYFDPAIIQVSSVAESDDGFYAASNFDNVEGWIFATGFETNGIGPNDMQDLFDITWNAIAEGISVIIIEVIDLTDETTTIIGIPNGISGEITVGTIYELGDVNNDGVVDIIDALLVAQYYVGVPVIIDLSVADVNLDNSVNIVDALIIAQYYVGEIPSLPYLG